MKSLMLPFWDTVYTESMTTNDERKRLPGNSGVSTVHVAWHDCNMAHHAPPSRPQASPSHVALCQTAIVAMLFRGLPAGPPQLLALRHCQLTCEHLPCRGRHRRLHVEASAWRQHLTLSALPSLPLQSPRNINSIPNLWLLPTYIGCYIYVVQLF